MNSSASPDALAVALSFFQAPTRHHDLLHGLAPLPPGMEKLLRLAGERALDSVPPNEHARAALFFIEQVLLAHDADHYRLLGVNREAGPDQIKENHRLLMRLFHPDRDSGIAPDIKESYASRINLAYNVLRQPETRAAYDLSLRQKRSAPAFSSTRPRASFMHMEPHPSGLMPSIIARNLPQFVLGSVAIIAAISVTSVYMARQPAGAIGWEPGASRLAQTSPVALPVSQAGPEHEEAQPVALPSDPLSTPEQAGAEESMQASVLATSLLPVVEPTPAPAPTKPAEATLQAVQAKPAAPARLAEAPAPQPMQAKPATPTPAPAAPPRPEPALPTPATRPTPAPAASTVAVVEVSQPAAVPAPTPPTSSAPQPASGFTETELGDLVVRFTRHYSSGDLEGFMALFDESARSESGDKTKIRNDYDKLFRTTAKHIIVVWDMAWQQNGNTAKGEGEFQAQVIRNGETEPRFYSGHINFETIRRGDTVLIRHFTHTLKR